jgi:DNA repair protein RadC
MDPTSEDRPRERMRALGGDRLSDRELLAIVLGTGTRNRAVDELAGDVLRAAGGLAALSRAAPSELERISGIGEARALRVAAAFCLGRKAVEVELAPGGAWSPERLWARLRARLAALPQEVFVVVGLDARGAVIDEVEVALGTLTGVEVHPREVFRPLIRMAAAAGVLAHNHPSGDSEPSSDDIEMTRRLREVGEVVGVPIIDHVVLGRDRWTSIAEFAGPLL